MADAEGRQDINLVEVTQINKPKTSNTNDVEKRAKHDLTFRGARSTAALAAAQSNDRVAIEAYNHGGGARAAAACSAAGGHSPPNRAAMVTAWHPGSDDSRYARLLEYKTKF